jgi:ketosteroid isomerase-like protein
MTTVEREYIEAVLGAFEQGDADDASAVFAEDGVFVDPRYPDEEYHGPEGVRRALEQGFENAIERSRFVVRNFWTNGASCAVEVESHHVTTDGSERAFSQVFVVETDNGRVTRWQSYLPCSPREGTD